MKKLTLLLAILCITICISISSCKKDALEKQQQRIDEIIPAKYLDTLKKLGATINTGIKPPNIEGIYYLNPAKLKASNIPGSVVGSIFGSVKIKFSSQNNDDFSIQYISNQGSVSDTSQFTAISGSGNKFTVYGRTKATTTYNSDYAFFSIVFSGEKDGSTIKNLEWSFINSDDSHGGSTFIEEGQSRVIYDGDFNSESITTLRKNGTQPMHTNPSSIYRR